MQANRSRDTSPEMAVRRELHRRGLRYRVALAAIPASRRTIDIAFTKARVAVMIDGCFWHGCPEHHQAPRTNAEFWLKKLTENKARDAETTSILQAAGWQVLRFWEHESVAFVVESIAKAVAKANNPNCPTE
jgi:DNA mismatch endonuclease (patch repair protein)